MTKSMDAFLHRLNVENFQHRLLNVTSEAQKRMLLTLLAEEAAYTLKNGTPTPMFG